MMSRELAVGLGVLAGLVVGGGVAYAATRSSTSSTSPSSSSSDKAPAPLPANAPAGLVSTGPTSTGWQVTICLPSDGSSGMLYPALLGDVITVELPAGAHWSSKKGVTSLGPASGTDPYVFTFIDQLGGYQLTWTDATSTDRTTVVYFGDSGVTFESATQLATYDYVLLAITSVNLEQLLASVTQWSQGQGHPTAAQTQEAANLLAIVNATAPKAPTQQQMLIALLAVGPWAEAFAPDIRQIVPFPIGSTLPTWAPSDTNGSTEAHVLYRYVGPGIDVASLPFPVTAWRRTV
jgi:hypothetical protein